MMMYNRTFLKRNRYLLFIILGYLPAQAQEAGKLMIDLLLTDSTIRSEITLKPSKEKKHILSGKEDQGTNDLLSLADQILVNNYGVFIGIESINGIFHVWPAGKGIRFQRLEDSSHHIDNIENGYLFSYQDTLFSLGGYNHWQYHGNLRYYNASHHRWEIEPINKKLPVLKNDPGNHYDYERGQFFYLDQNRPSDLGLFKTQDSSKTEYTSLPLLFVLDLKTKTWIELGAISPEFYKLVFTHQKIVSTPGGALLTATDKPDHAAYLIDYRANKIFKMVNKRKLLHVREATHGLNHQPNELATFFQDSTIHMLNASVGHYTLRLSPADFILMPFKVYTESKPEVATVLRSAGRRNWIIIVMICFILIPPIFIIFFNGRKRKKLSIKISNCDLTKWN